MNRPIPIIGFLLLMTVGSAMAEQVVTSDAVLIHIRLVGSRQALNDYFQASTWPALMRGIKSGDDGWLKVFAALRPAADAAASEDLGDAIFDAIPKRPFRVLPLVALTYKETIRQVCTFTFESQEPEGGVDYYLNQLDRSLQLATTSDQRQIAAECSLGIEATRKEFGGSDAK